MNKEYEKFVKDLMKSGDVMDKEISSIEELLLEKTFLISDQTEQFKYNCYDSLIGRFSFIGRNKILELKHMIVGVIGESAELLDPVKRIVIYRKKFNDILKDSNQSIINNIIEEIGDLYFYVIGAELVIKEIIELYRSEFQQDEIGEFNIIFQELNLLTDIIKQFINEINNYAGSEIICFDRCIELNYEKLRKRYEKGQYSDAQANERKDKEVTETPILGF